MTDWKRNKSLLVECSEPMVRALFDENKAKGDVIAAIGYVFEFGRGQLCFAMCANTARSAKKSAAQSLEKYPKEPVDEVRWNSGDYDYPGGLDQFSTEWWNELRRLDRLVAADEAQSKSVHDGITEICCEALADLAILGALGDWSVIDFNVAALFDDVRLVQHRDGKIRELIRSKVKPR